MFGAKGDGKTDDTAAFQKAVNSGYDVFVPTSHHESYLITNTIQITNKQCKRIFSETINRMGTSGIIADFSNCPDPKTTPLFDVHIQLFRLAGLRFFGRAGEHRIGLFLKARDEDLCDYDIRIEQCSVKNFYRILSVTGRGCEIYNSTITSSNYLGDFYWIDEKDSNNNHPAMYDQRAICIKNCRIHNMSSAFLIIRSGHAYGLHFEGNTVDNGTGFLVRAYDQAWGWNISGNVIQGIKGEFPFMDFRKGMQNCVITGNTFISDTGYWVGSEKTVNSWIKSAGSTRSSIISNNVFKNSEGEFMAFSNIQGTCINGNAMHNVRESTLPAIRITNNCHKNSFVGNTFISNANNKLLSKTPPSDNAVTGNYP